MAVWPFWSVAWGGGEGFAAAAVGDPDGPDEGDFPGGKLGAAGEKRGGVDEEVEAVGDVLGQGACLTGFYSYGEISPFAPGVACKLHNQTMTITYLGED